jgi:hypothetical protein
MRVNLGRRVVETVEQGDGGDRTGLAMIPRELADGGRRKASFVRTTPIEVADQIGHGMGIAGLAELIGCEFAEVVVGHGLLTNPAFRGAELIHSSQYTAPTDHKCASVGGYGPGSQW